MQSAPAKTLTIGSRGSQLALWQAHHIAGLLERCGVGTRITVIKTTGDHLQTASLTAAGGKGLFTKEIEEALLAGAIDLAVHSLKDLPTETPAGLQIAAIPEREDPRDALVGKRLDELTPGSRVGTSSSRRAAQLRALRSDLSIEAVRGNVDTRLRKLKEGQYDAVLLAAAGLRRLGLASEIAQVLEPDLMCPAPGQGALAIQTRLGDDTAGLSDFLNHEASFQAVTCERAALATLGGGCQLPVGAFAQLINGTLHLMVVVVAPDGSKLLRAAGQDAPREASALGAQVGRELLDRGAGQILSAAR
jgi:hydroxymethylbilane synthase